MVIYRSGTGDMNKRKRTQRTENETKTIRPSFVFIASNYLPFVFTHLNGVDTLCSSCSIVHVLHHTNTACALARITESALIWHCVCVCVRISSRRLAKQLLKQRSAENLFPVFPGQTPAVFTADNSLSFTVVGRIRARAREAFGAQQTPKSKRYLYTLAAVERVDNSKRNKHSLAHRCSDSFIGLSGCANGRIFNCV